MILLVSGEGPTDIGACIAPAEACEGEDFRAGSMALLIDQLVAMVWGYSPLDSTAMAFIPEGALAAKSREVKPLPKQLVLPGRKGAKETGFFFKNARALAQLAKARTAAANCPVAAILFRDADGTNSADHSLWADKVHSMERGFSAEDFELGVAMVPRPKSEAWLLCALQEQPYANCEVFENLPGNDDSPNSAKGKIAAALAAMNKTVADIPDLATDGTISATRISMPSYDRFRQRMEIVAKTMMK